MALGRTAKLGVAAGVLVLAAGMFGGLYYVAGLRRAQQGVAGATPIAVSASACEPNELTVPAGRTTFAIENRSQRALEWEILDGVIVVDERENIAPGFTQTLTARLEPGEYVITCGLLSNPRGKLHVVAAKDGDGARPAKPDLVQFIGPVAEYEVFLIGELDTLTSAATDLSAAVRGNDLERARSLYLAARLPYARIKPMAGMFSDLDARLDGRAADYPGGAADPAFLGFDRLEQGLFARNSTAGLAPVADQLEADARELSARLETLTPSPERLVVGAQTVVQKMPLMVAADAGSREGGADRQVLQASLEGAAKITALLAPLTGRADPALGDRIAADLRSMGDVLRGQAAAGDGAGADRLDPRDGEALRRSADALADRLATMRAVLGLG